AEPFRPASMAREIPNRPEPRSRQRPPRSRSESGKASLFPCRDPHPMPAKSAPIDEEPARYASTLPRRPTEEWRGMQRSAVKIQTRQTVGSRANPPDFVPSRTIVLVGLMGAGKTKIGRRLAARLGLPFFDSDCEIEAAAGETIDEIFRHRGEAVFRDGERRVIARLLMQPPHVLATGGGAFMDSVTRAVIASRGV